MIYKYQQQWMNLTEEKASQILIDLEKGLRTSTFKYKKPTLSKKQYEEMQKNWSPEAIAFFKEKATKIAGDQKVNSEIAYQAAVATVKEFIAPIREKKNVAFSSLAIQRNAMLDIAVSSMLDVAFEGGETVSSIKVVDGKKIDIRYTSCKMKVNDFRIRFIIACEEAEKSDIFIFAMHNPHLDRMTLLGWKTQSELRSCKRGNKNTTPEECSWKKMSFYFGYPELNPLSDYLNKAGLKEIPEGILLEQIAQQHNIPIPNPELTNGIEKSTDTTRSKAADDFYKSLGLEDPIKSVVPDQPKQTTVNTDDWAM